MGDFTNRFQRLHNAGGSLGMDDGHKLRSTSSNRLFNGGGINGLTPGRLHTYDLRASTFCDVGHPVAEYTVDANDGLVARFQQIDKAGFHSCATRRRHDEGQVDFSFERDRKSTRLNSSHVKISYAVFCLKKKKLIAK